MSDVEPCERDAFRNDLVLCSSLKDITFNSISNAVKRVLPSLEK
jgi:hypothetical protein